jgi:hypothetical protein
MAAAPTDWYRISPDKDTLRKFTQKSDLKGWLRAGNLEQGVKAECLPSKRRTPSSKRAQLFHQGAFRQVLFPRRVGMLPPNENESYDNGKQKS